ncbi:hypothetical protein HY489_03640 [Candidatus Woesearchaeota archaeon]|nr:hypothetical protein [Candidatus Woesearchaeota archaeon]
MKPLWYFIATLLTIGILAGISGMTPTGSFAANIQPKWDYPTTQFSRTFTLDLNQAFSDPDGDTLTFTAAPDQGISISKSDNLIAVNTEQSGTILLTASDGQAITLQRITIA